MEWTPLATAVVGLLIGSGGIIAWVRLHRIDEPASEAQIAKVRADTRASEAQILLEALQALREQMTWASGRMTNLSEQVTAQEGHIVQLRRANADVQDELRAVQATAREVRTLLADHSRWDQLVLAEVRKMNPDFPDPPPLIPKQQQASG